MPTGSNTVWSIHKLEVQCPQTATQDRQCAKFFNAIAESTRISSRCSVGVHRKVHALETLCFDNHSTLSYTLCTLAVRSLGVGWGSANTTTCTHIIASIGWGETGIIVQHMLSPSVWVSLSEGRGMAICSGLLLYLLLAAAKVKAIALGGTATGFCNFSNSAFSLHLKDGCGHG